MKLYWRLMLLFLRYRKQPAVPSLGPSTTKFRVVPTDLDLLMHVNNGVYLTLMDVARVDMMLRSGLVGQFRPLGWYPVIVASTMRFRRSLELWQRFDIVTDVIGWDEKSVFLHQRFMRADELVAEGIVASRFLQKSGGSVTTAQLMDAIGHTDEPPILPAWITSWYADSQPSTEPETA